MAPAKKASKKTAPKTGKKIVKKAAPSRPAPKKASKPAAKPAPRPSKPAPRASVKPAARTSAPAPAAKPGAKPAPREVPKVSPLAGTSVDAWCAALTPNAQAVVGALRALMKAVTPEATELMKWGQPVYEIRGPFAYIKPAGGHVTFGFWRGTEIADPKGMLEGIGDRMRHVKVASAELDRPALEAFVRQAAALNREKGDPTKRP